MNTFHMQISLSDPMFKAQTTPYDNMLVKFNQILLLIFIFHSFALQQLS